MGFQSRSLQNLDTSSLSLLSGPLGLGEEERVRVPSMDQIDILIGIIIDIK